jgi:predicted cation transporter
MSTEVHGGDASPRATRFWLVGTVTMIIWYALATAVLIGSTSWAIAQARTARERGYGDQEGFDVLADLIFMMLGLVVLAICCVISVVVLVSRGRDKIRRSSEPAISTGTAFRTGTFAAGLVLGVPFSVVALVAAGSGLLALVRG